MGNPKLIKSLVWLGVVAGLIWGGLKYIRENPDAADIRRIQAPAVHVPVPALDK